MEMYVIQEKKENCGNSVFYKGQVAYAVMPNGRKIALQACGDVKFVLPNPDHKFDVYGHAAASGGIEKMEIAGLTDVAWPGTGRTIRELLAALHSDEVVQRLEGVEA